MWKEFDWNKPSTALSLHFYQMGLLVIGTVISSEEYGILQGMMVLVECYEQAK